MSQDRTRRDVLVGAVATVAAAALPVVSEPELGMFEWMEQAERTR